MEEKERCVVNWRGGLLYILFLQIEVLVTSLFLWIAVLPIRFVFDDGFVRNLLEIMTLFPVEMAFRFFLFFVFFKNNRRLGFGYFAQGFAIAFGIRFIFSFITRFAAFSAGPSVLQISSTITQLIINPEAKGIYDVPRLLSSFVFLLFEGVTLLLGYLAFKLAESMREKEKSDLINN